MTEVDSEIPLLVGCVMTVGLRDLNKNPCDSLPGGKIGESYALLVCPPQPFTEHPSCFERDTGIPFQERSKQICGYQASGCPHTRNNVRRARLASQRRHLANKITPHAHGQQRLVPSLCIYNDLG